MSDDTNELIVVSGASTGMGAATARELALRGYQVLAGVRRESDDDPLRTERIEPIILDITRPADIAGVTARVASDPFGRRLRAVVNNAAIAINAPVETLPIDEWRRLFEVNLFGHIALTQANPRLEPPAALPEERLWRSARRTVNPRGDQLRSAAVTSPLGSR